MWSDRNCLVAHSAREWTQTALGDAGSRRRLSRRLPFQQLLDHHRWHRKTQQFATPQTACSPSVWLVCPVKERQCGFERAVAPPVLAATRLRQVPACWHSVSLWTAPAFATATAHVSPHPEKCRLWLSLVSTSLVQPEGYLVVDRFGPGDCAHEPADMPLCLSSGLGPASIREFRRQAHSSRLEMDCVNYGYEES